MSLRNRLILSVRWHRRIGLLTALFVLLLSITGLLLNHTSDLKLDNIKLNSPFLARLYGLPDIAPVAFVTQDHWITHNGIAELYLNEQAIGQCTAPLQGAVVFNELLHVLCQNELLLFTEKGQLLETVTPMLGLPAGAHAIAGSDKQLVLGTPEGTLVADLDTLQFLPAQVSPDHWPTPQALPKELQQFIQQQAPAMDLEQVLLDLHSGRLFGRIGVIIMDLSAILLITLSITGFIAWNSSRQMRRR